MDPSIIPRTDILTYNPDTEDWTKISDMIVGRYEHDFTTVAWKDYSQYCEPDEQTPTTLAPPKGDVGISKIVKP